MKTRGRKSKVRNRKRQVLLLLVLACSAASGGDLPARCADRAAIERVYHAHRLGTKQPFEEAMPADLLESLVRSDLHKEAVLERVYGVTVTPEMVAAEVRRIDATTRAPEMLAEIKAALGNDPQKFAFAFARPIVVERELRRRFDNDDALHAPERRVAEQARERLRAGQPVADTREVTWLLTARPADEEPATNTGPPPETKETVEGGAYSVEATAHLAQRLTPPAGADRKLYFADLDPELQRVLRVQLRRPGDVSAVIEMPGGFLVFQAKEITDTALTVSSLSIPKRSYDEWLASQTQQ